MEFEIFYADGEMVSGSGRQGWAAAPVDGVQVVICSGPRGNPDVLFSCDFYGYDSANEKIITSGVKEQMLRGTIKYGTLMPSNEFDSLLRGSISRSKLVETDSVNINEYYAEGQ